MIELRGLTLALRAAARFVRDAGPLRALRLLVVGTFTIGPRAVIRRAAAETQQRADDERYRAWMAEQQQPAAHRVEVSAPRPRISILTPVHDTDPEWLRRCLGSIRQQSYGHWELCLADDRTTRRDTLDVLGAIDDPRIRVIRLEGEGGIARATNAALAAATGDFVAFVDHDDELAPTALADIVDALTDQADADVLYSDEDKISAADVRSQVHFKPDWSPELLRSCMYVSHLLVMRRTLVQSLCGLDPRVDGAQDYDLLLRASLATDRMVHVPKVLYHWREASGSAAASQLAKPWAVAAGKRALEADVQRRGADAQVLSAGAAGHYRVKYAIAGTPAVAIVQLRTAGAGANVDARWLQTTARGIRVESVAVERAEDVSKIVQRTTADHLLFVSGVTRAITSEWIAAMVEFSQQPQIGAVGPLILAADGRIDSAGLVIGGDGTPLRAFAGEPAWTRGHLSNILDVRNCSAVSRACVMTRRDVFDAAGGFDIQLDGEFAALDYGLKMRDRGLRVVITPHAVVGLRDRAAARAANGDDEQARRLRATWGSRLDRDPYYNPNFDRSAATFRLPGRATGRSSP